MAPRKKAPAAKKKLSYALSIAITIITLVLLESALRIAGAGYSTAVFLPHPELDGYLVDNPSFVRKYHTGSNIPVSQKKNIFTEEKESGSIRGFVLGGSTAEGFPFYSNHSFSKLLEKSLAASGRFTKAEVLNLGFSAMSSYYVADAAQKLLSYDPDFLIIYSGHNEIYGTVSYTTGGSRFSKKVYLFLKEFRIFQLFYSLLNREPAAKQDSTLMSRQFSGGIMPADAAVDNAVARDFIANIEAVVSAYSSRGIPVFIIDPVSNIIDMPPFAGLQEDALAREIASYRNALTGSRTALKSAYTKRLAGGAPNRSNSHLRWLDGKAELTLGIGKPLDTFTDAKDLDIIPFRMRSPLNIALASFAKDRAADYPNMVFIPAAALLTAQYGSSILGNRIFIDQLHFNWNGQKAAASLLARSLAAHYRFDQPSIRKMNGYLSQPDASLKKSIYLLPFHQRVVYRKISSLLADIPFGTMKIPYRQGSFAEVFPGAAVRTDSAFSSKITAALEKDPSFNEAFGLLIEDLAAAKEYRALHDYFQSQIAITPGDPSGYLYLARYYAAYDIDLDRAAENYVTAYRISEKDTGIFNEMKDFFRQTGNIEIFNQVIDQFGTP